MGIAASHHVAPLEMNTLDAMQCGHADGCQANCKHKPVVSFIAGITAPPGYLGRRSWASFEANILNWMFPPVALANGGFVTSLLLDVLHFYVAAWCHGLAKASHGPCWRHHLWRQGHSPGSTRYMWLALQVEQLLLF